MVVVVVVEIVELQLHCVDVDLGERWRVVDDFFDFLGNDGRAVVEFGFMAAAEGEAEREKEEREDDEESDEDSDEDPETETEYCCSSRKLFVDESSIV